MCRSSSSMINRKSSTLKLARKTRTKTRKPKFLSLIRLDLSPENTQQSGGMTSSATATNHRHKQQQLNLFPLRPENSLVDDKDSHDDNVAYFFDASDGGAATLTTLLGAGSSSSEDDENTTTNKNSISPPSLTYAYGGQDSGEGRREDLVRAALRNKERDASEERWVCYSEVVERKVDEEVSSCAADLRLKLQTHGLSLKLDYQEIMNAWSDKGPLYIQLESPQTVPDLHDDHFISNGMVDGWGSNGGLWTVPENSSISSSTTAKGNMKVKEEVISGGVEEWKIGQREASVLRYKEKRQNRLFSKRIRYEVRKINAEKRPRMKGRFVKRS